MSPRTQIERSAHASKGRERKPPSFDSGDAGLALLHPLVRCARLAFVIAFDRRRSRFAALLVVAACAGHIVTAQQRPVAAMFDHDQKRSRTLASSFATTELPAAAGAPSMRVYLSAGDLERAFDRQEFRPDAVVLPTNTALAFTAANPATQRVLVERLRAQPVVLRHFEDEAAARRTKGALQVGVDTFVAQLSSSGAGRFPRSVCMIATDFAQGGAVDRRELLTQDRLRQGIVACLAAFDASGAVTVMMPLMGASSSEEQKNDPVFEGQRLLKECRLINSVAGLALGVHDFAPKRKSIREIGIVQWEQDIQEMFGLPKASRAGQASYQTYAEQVTVAWRKGLAGEKMTPGDAGGNCAATFSQ